MYKTFQDFLEFITNHDLSDSASNCENVAVEGGKPNLFFDFTDAEAQFLMYQIHPWVKEDTKNEYIDVRLYTDVTADSRVFMMLIEFNITNKTFSMITKETETSEMEFQATGSPISTQILNFKPNKSSKLWDEVLCAWVNSNAIKTESKIFNGCNFEVTFIDTSTSIRRTINGKRRLCGGTVLMKIPTTKAIKTNFETVKCGEKYGIPVGMITMSTNWKYPNFDAFDIVILPFHFINRVGRISQEGMRAYEKLPNVYDLGEAVYDEKGLEVIGYNGLIKAWIE